MQTVLDQEAVSTNITKYLSSGIIAPTWNKSALSGAWAVNNSLEAKIVSGPFILKTTILKKAAQQPVPQLSFQAEIPPFEEEGWDQKAGENVCLVVWPHSTGLLFLESPPQGRGPKENQAVWRRTEQHASGLVFHEGSYYILA